MLKRIAILERRLMLATLRLFMTRMEKIGPLAVEHWYDCQAQPQPKNTNFVSEQ